MTILAIILLIIFGYFLDWVMSVLTGLDIPYIIALIVPVLLIGRVLDMFDMRYPERMRLEKWLRIIILGAITTAIILLPMPWILRPILIALEVYIVQFWFN